MKELLAIAAFILNVLAPMPTGIAYNPETKECGYYQGGDEYASNVLPQPWVVNYGDPIQTESGIHQWDGNYESIENFCKELGYTFVPGNLGELYGQRTSSPLLGIRMICKSIPIVFLIIVVIIGTSLFARWKKKHNKTQQ
jgi:hypothetical protein